MNSLMVVPLDGMRMSGFTLIETIICLTLMAILSIGSVYGARYWQMHAQTTIQLSALKHAILQCQEQARASHRKVVFCGSQSGKNCDGNWSAGWLSYWSNANQKQQVIYHRVGSKLVRWSFRSSLGKNDRLIFNPQGDNLGQQGSFYYCPKYYQKTFVRRQYLAAIIQKCIFPKTGIRFAMVCKNVYILSNVLTVHFPK